MTAFMMLGKVLMILSELALFAVPVLLVGLLLSLPYWNYRSRLKNWEVKDKAFQKAIGTLDAFSDEFAQAAVDKAAHDLCRPKFFK